MSGNLRVCYNESKTNRNTIGMPEKQLPLSAACTKGHIRPLRTTLQVSLKGRI